LADQGQKVVKTHHDYLSRELTVYIRGVAVSNEKNFTQVIVFGIKEEI